MGCDILLEDGSRILLEDGTSALLLDGCTPTSGGGTGCNILLDENTGKVLADDGVSAILQDGCTSIPTATSPEGGYTFIVPRRRLPAIRIPLTDDEDEYAVALTLLETIRDRRKLSG